MSFQITGHTRLGGLLGSPVAHSKSPMMHNDSFRELGIDAVYLCFDVGPDRLDEVTRALCDMNAYGFNLTMPDKEKAVELMDELSTEARIAGAVNTVKIDNGKMTGYNTDGTGYFKAVTTAGFDVKGKEMTLIGAGGAGGAIASAAAAAGVSKLHLVNRRSRSWDRAQQLVDSINSLTDIQADLIDLADTTELNKAIGESYLLTNATSAGMAPHEDLLPISDLSCLRPELIVSDVIYNPSQTRLMKEAAAIGCPTFNGLYMLLFQGEEAFHIWTGQQMPVELIKERYFS